MQLSTLDWPVFNKGNSFKQVNSHHCTLKLSMQYVRLMSSFRENALHAQPTHWVAFKVIINSLVSPLPPTQSSGGEIVAVDNRYEIINSTGSLVVHNSNQMPERLKFYCTARNLFGTSMSNNFTVEFFSVGKCSGIMLHSDDVIVEWGDDTHCKMPLNCYAPCFASCCLSQKASGLAWPLDIESCPMWNILFVGIIFTRNLQ